MEKLKEVIVCFEILNPCTYTISLFGLAEGCCPYVIPWACSIGWEDVK
jgi:hypothetical protein